MALTTFTSGQVLTAAQLNAVQANDYNQTVSTKTASYTLVAADKGTRVVMNAAGATTITVNTSLFSAGDTLVLQNIGAGTTTVTAGTATVSSAGSLAIPTNGSGLLYFTSAGVSIFYPSAVSVSSAVVQVKSTTLTSSFSVATALGTYAAITGLEVTITPTSASNKILLLATVSCNFIASQGLTGILTGGNCANYRGDAAGNRQQAASGIASGADRTNQSMGFNFLDAPATTSATTYGVSMNFVANTGTQTIFVNRDPIDDNQFYTARYASTITAIEVAP
jgi:hypothetical protein